MPVGALGRETRALVACLRSSAKVAGETPARQPPGRRRYEIMRYPAASMLPPSQHFSLEELTTTTLLRLHSPDGTNRLTQACVRSLTDAIESLSLTPGPLILTGNSKFFSTGADLSEIAALTRPAAFEFSKMGQRLMNAIERFPAPVYAAIEGYCMGGGLDLALACHRRIASPHAIFGHRGAALGLITGWGGTQRLPLLIGKARALAMLVAAEKLHAGEALKIGLVDAVVEDPVAEARRRIESAARSGN
jgi:enoyl-CoA hydratase/carnithine racemase